MIELFNNGGKELKFWARARVWFIAAIGGVVGIAVALIIGVGSVFDILCFIGLFGLIGYTIGRFMALKSYAYAEIVDSVQKIKEKLYKEKSTVD